MQATSSTFHQAMGNKKWLLRQIDPMKQKAFASFWPSKGSPRPGKGQMYDLATI